MKRFVYNEKYAKLLVLMEGKKSLIDDLARRVDANSGHLRIVLEQWHKEGILNKDKPGRDYEITLTEKGSRIALKLAEVMELVDHYKPKKKDPVTQPAAPITTTPPVTNTGGNTNGTK